MYKIFRATVLLTLLCLRCIDALGQEISVKSHIRELSNDITARKYEKTDAQGNACAVIKVELPSLPDISFTGSVGDVKQNAGEYVLYVSPGITSIDVMRGKNLVCTIDMEGVDIEAKHTYQVVLALKREKVFRVMPENAEIVVNGERIDVDSTGIGRMNCEVGVMYNYTISAPDYESISDHFMIVPEEAQVAHINKRLNRKTGRVMFNCKTKRINVFAGVERIDREKSGFYRIPLGTHNIRITSEDYEDWTGEVSVKENEFMQTVPVVLEKPKNGVSKRLRTRYELYASVGYYTTTSSKGEDNGSVSNFVFNIGFSPELYLIRWLTFRPGFELMGYGGRYFEMAEDDFDEYSLFNLSIPLVFSLNYPMGKYNQHHFSVGAGPLIGLGILVDWTDEDDNSSEEHDGGGDWLVGLRISAQLTLSHFIIGVNLDYQKYMCKKIYPNSFIVPMATIGYKF